MSKSTPYGIPGVDMMTDTFDLMKNLWGNMPGMNVPGMKNIPGMVMPTLSVEEIDKQIKDLKAVESWLSLNMNMLQGTIQALEVQRSTISTLKTMGESFTAAMQPPSMSGTAEKSAFQSPFAPQSGAWPSAPEKPPVAEKPAASEPAARAEQPAADPAAGADLSGAMPPLANPAAWWGMLQDQFKQAVDSAAAMTPEAPAATAPAKPAAGKAASKVAGKVASAPSKRKAPPKA